MENKKTTAPESNTRDDDELRSRVHVTDSSAFEVSKSQDDMLSTGNLVSINASVVDSRAPKAPTSASNLTKRGKVLKPGAYKSNISSKVTSAQSTMTPERAVNHSASNTEPPRNSYEECTCSPCECQPGNSDPGGTPLNVAHTTGIPASPSSSTMSSDICRCSPCECSPDSLVASNQNQSATKIIHDQCVCSPCECSSPSEGRNQSPGPAFSTQIEAAHQECNGSQCQRAPDPKDMSSPVLTLATFDTCNCSPCECTWTPAENSSRTHSVAFQKGSTPPVPTIELPIPSQSTSVGAPQRRDFLQYSPNLPKLGQLPLSHAYTMPQMCQSTTEYYSQIAMAASQMTTRDYAQQYPTLAPNNFTSQQIPARNLHDVTGGQLAAFYNRNASPSSWNTPNYVYSSLREQDKAKWYNQTLYANNLCTNIGCTEGGAGSTSVMLQPGYYLSKNFAPPPEDPVFSGGSLSSAGVHLRLCNFQNGNQNIAIAPCSFNPQEDTHLRTNTATGGLENPSYCCYPKRPLQGKGKSIGPKSKDKTTPNILLVREVYHFKKPPRACPSKKLLPPSPCSSICCRPPWSNAYKNSPTRPPSRLLLHSAPVRNPGGCPNCKAHTCICSPSTGGQGKSSCAPTTAKVGGICAQSGSRVVCDCPKDCIPSSKDVSPKKGCAQESMLLRAPVSLVREFLVPSNFSPAQLQSLKCRCNLKRKSSKFKSEGSRDNEKAAKNPGGSENPVPVAVLTTAPVPVLNMGSGLDSRSRRRSGSQQASTSDQNKNDMNSTGNYGIELEKPHIDAINEKEGKQGTLSLEQAIAPASSTNIKNSPRRAPAARLSKGRNSGTSRRTSSDEGEGRDVISEIYLRRTHMPDSLRNYGVEEFINFKENKIICHLLPKLVEFYARL